MSLEERFRYDVCRHLLYHTGGEASRLVSIDVLDDVFSRYGFWCKPSSIEKACNGWVFFVRRDGRVYVGFRDEALPGVLGFVAWFGEVMREYIRNGFYGEWQ